MELLIVGAIVAIILVWGVSTYNGLIQERLHVKEGWSAIDVQLQRRGSLIPNLVETVKGYAQQEQTIFTAVADARARLGGAVQSGNLAQMAEANQGLTGALSRLLAISENYPQLKSNESFNRLMDELSGTENRIAVERMRYNERVQEYNTARRQFPGNITAGIFSFKEHALFAAPPEAKQVPKVNFGSAK